MDMIGRAAIWPAFRAGARFAPVCCLFWQDWGLRRCAESSSPELVWFLRLAAAPRSRWSRLIAGHNGASRVTAFDVSDIAAQIACSVPTDTSVEGGFNPDDWMEPKEQRKIDKFILFGVAAAEMALKDAGWKPESREDQIATGVMIGSGIGGLEGIVEAGYTLRDKGPRRISPFFIPGRLINLVSGQVSIRHGLRGPNHAVVTACSTGAARHWRRRPADRAGRRRC